MISSKPPRFDAVSIRPSKGDGRQMMSSSPDEFIAKGNPLFATVMSAYFPQSPRYWTPDRLAGAPPWVFRENYDVEAKLDMQTAGEWKNLSSGERRERMQPMLRAMLADRCKLAAHVVEAQVQGFALVVGKHGVKFRETTPNVAAPYGGSPLASGGWIVRHPSSEKPARLTFVGVSMATVAEFVMVEGDRPVRDMTGLKGRYDVEILRRDDDLSRSDPDPAGPFDVRSVGLDLKAMKVPSVTVVVDHIDRPTPN